MKTEILTSKSFGNGKSRTRTSAKTLAWLGIGLILATGLIHFVEAPEAFEQAVYKGALFLANGIAAIFAAATIWRRNSNFGWTLGAIVALGSIIGYAASRTVGLPGTPVMEWLEPIGIASLVVEIGFVIVAAKRLNVFSR